MEKPGLLLAYRPIFQTLRILQLHSRPKFNRPVFKFNDDYEVSGVRVEISIINCGIDNADDAH